MSARFSSREQARVFRALESFTSLIYTSDLHRSPSLVEAIFLRTFDGGCVVWWYFFSAFSFFALMTSPFPDDAGYEEKRMWCD